MLYKNIITESSQGVFKISLNRPRIHNALDADMVTEMIYALGEVENNPQARVLLIQGEGPSFCAGADLNFMQEVVASPKLKEFGELLQELLFEMIHCRLPVISAVKGSVFGGALGLLAASDIVIASESSRFSFSETKIGMIPAAILPFVNKRIGSTNTRYLTLSAMRFDAHEALKAGLVNKVVPEESLEKATEELISEIRLSSPEATSITKTIINGIDNRTVLIDSASYSIHYYDSISKSENLKEGLKAFREKRKPEWTKAGRKDERGK